MTTQPDYPALAEARPGWRFEPEDDCLRGRVILVTGAGAGIGRTAAQTFATFGADVVLLGRTRSHLEAVFDWISEHTQTDPVIVPADLAALDDAAAESLASAIHEHYGRLDGLLHNASTLGPKVPIAHYPTSDFEAALKVNVSAAFVLSRSLEPLLRESNDASVVFTSSSVGRAGRAYWGAYSVSKFAVEGLVQVWADELDSAGIRVNSVNPGGTRTAMRAAAYPAENPEAVPRPEQHMDLYLYLLSAASRGVTGQQLDARTWQP